MEFSPDYNFKLILLYLKMEIRFVPFASSLPLIKKYDSDPVKSSLEKQVSERLHRFANGVQVFWNLEMTK